MQLVGLPVKHQLEPCQLEQCGMRMSESDRHPDRVCQRRAETDRRVSVVSRHAHQRHSPTYTVSWHWHKDASDRRARQSTKLERPTAHGTLGTRCLSGTSGRARETRIPVPGWWSENQTPRCQMLFPTQRFVRSRTSISERRDWPSVAIRHHNRAWS